ncbi:hypothetical protein NUW58_g9757 [Xylaria curta]|uniref:Uncharacterized protein n=1 Tax=Xylaria curta TaxID=42375 RepID=A0ACC1MU93_9PEZI|nr:hypothetical protein NUW58_g9757 [Xylaria curta]
MPTLSFVNKALDYSPRMGGVYMTPYTCTVFEANEADVPPTKFDWVLDDKSLLRINQTWSCDDGAATGTRFQSIGDRDIKSLLSCSTLSRNYPIAGGTYVESFETCITTSSFEIKGGLR